MTFPVLSAGTSAYNLQRSLRFRASALAYLNRTPASAGNRQKFTLSYWIKLNPSINNPTIFCAGDVGVRPTATLGAFFNTFAGGGGPAGCYNLQSYNGSTYDYNISTSQVFRDPASWYHMVVAFDTTQATASNRIKLYVNGVQITAFGTANYPTQNFNTAINNTVLHTIVSNSFASSSGDYLDGYLAEMNFVDAQQLTPSSFGSTNAVTGVWQPAKYTGTYGTNGFYLPFTNTTSTSTLGNDFSGNSNNWTTNNISLTPGVTYDSMTDVPTLTSATAANYPVLNPLSIYVVNPTDGNLAFSGTSAGGIGSMGATSGKYYWETVYTAIGSGDGVIVGVRSAESIATGAAENVGYYGGGTQSGQKIINGGAGTAYGATWTTGDVIGVALDITGGSITFYKNNVSQGAISYTFTGKSWVSFNWRTGSAGTNTGSINFGQRPFAYTPPSGFVALNTFNLPSSTIPNGANFMAADIYTGNGSSQTRTLNFQPDFIWNKIRSQAYDHNLFDVLRGVDKRLISNLTTQELTITNALTAFNSNGYSVGNYVSINGSGESIVNWAWKAGGAGVTNTAGSITSTVSANTTSGFSVVTYTANGTNGATVGHGLNVTPAIYIVKRRNTTGNWVVVPGNSSLFGGSFYLQLNTFSAVIANSDVFTSYPGSSVFYLSTNADVNASGGTYVAYCIAQIAGFSAVGKYTGNGSTDGPFVYTGFRPRFVMIKAINDIFNWRILDTSRDISNVEEKELYPSLSNAEATQVTLDGLSNGFKIRTTGAGINTSAGAYLYVAFAENPFKNALAR